MINKSKNEEKFNKYLSEAVEHMETHGFEDLKADTTGYDSPAKMVNQTSGIEFTPDITATQNGKKTYAEIGFKTKDERTLVTKWRLLSTLSEMKGGSFKIYVPHGHLKFTREILDKYDVNAEPVKLF